MIAPLDRRSSRMENAARRAAERDREFRDEREPTVASRLGQIGVLGWAIVAPILLGVVVGRWLDWTSEDGNLLHCSPHHDRRRGGPVDRMAMDAPAMNVVILAAAFAAGAALGAAHFGSLWWSVALMRNGRERDSASPCRRCASSCSRRCSC